MTGDNIEDYPYFFWASRIFSDEIKNEVTEFTIKIFANILEWPRAS